MDTTENKRTKYLGLDIGTKRVGVAISDSLKKIAFPYEIISFKEKNSLLMNLQDIILKENIEKVIIGDPINIQGNRSSLTEGLYEIIEFLKDNLDVDIQLYDERYTTKIAYRDLQTININSKKGKNVIDKIAASIILQSYLESA